MTKKFDIVCFGEVLWDVFPDNAVIGGAPLNVALRCQSLGFNTAMISKVGNDDYGAKILDFLKKRNLSIDFIQKDDQLPTGKVMVNLDEAGTASYKIISPVAWDAIELTDHIKGLVSESKVLVFGSLVCRNEKSRSTLKALINLAAIKVFDVNLRPPDYDLSMLIELMESSDLVKMNSEELREISNYLRLSNLSEEQIIEEIGKRTKTKTICITKGGEGAVLFHEGQFYAQKGFRVKVADTVGAGDSFLATLITELVILKSHPKEALKKACAIGSLVASKSGANPILSGEEILKMIQ